MVDAVRDWLKALGALVAASMSVEESRARLDAFTPLLIASFDARYFSMESLAYVAERSKYFPVYGELTSLLRQWLNEAKPISSSCFVAIRDDNGLNETDHAWMEYYYARQREQFAPLRTPLGALCRPDITDWQEHTLGLVQSKSQAAYEQITRQK